MNYVFVGQINVVNNVGVTEAHDIYILLCGRSASESWAIAKAKYYPGYDGPDPALLSNYA
jgi:hypothetical protein